MFTLGELAERLGLEFSGDPKRTLKSIAPLASAGADQLSFLSNRKYLDQLEASNAGAVIVRPDLQQHSRVDVLLSDDPYHSYAQATQLYTQEPLPQPGIHPTAVVDDTVQMGEGVSIGPFALIEAGVSLGDSVAIGSHCSIGAHSVLGAGTRLYPGVVVNHRVVLGRDCAVHSNSVIGADGFGYALHPDGWEKICQLGSVRIGDRVEIGASSTVDRGALDDTVIEDGVIIDDQVHIAHNCRIGKNTAIAGCVGVAGSTTIGANCTLAGQVGVSGHLSICDNVVLTGQARVTKSITEPGVYGSGTPLAPQREWARNAIRFTQLDNLHQRLKKLEDL
ncbi:MAG: UDP-3-O-(3-hydroxymyristoyl)glucosamine N-acyltransferase [Halioglobus sp.]